MIALVEPSVGSSEPVPVSTLQKTVSASRLNCWLQCRLKFFFRYVLKITKPKTGALHYGSVVHLVLQQWNMGRWRKQPFDISKLKQVFDTGWLDQGQINWDGEELDQKTSAWNVLEKYFIDTPIKANEMPEAVEVPVEADLSKHGLSAQLPASLGLWQTRPCRRCGARRRRWRTACGCASGQRACGRQRARSCRG